MLQPSPLATRPGIKPPALVFVRKARKLSQTAVGAKAGLSAQYVCDLEKGRRHGNADVIAALATALDVDPAVITA